MTVMSKPKNSEIVYYLAQAYTNHEQLSFFEAIRDSGKLRKRGHTVFSHIMHNHQYSIEIYQKDNGILDAPDKEDYLQWDLALCEGWLQHDSTHEMERIECTNIGKSQSECSKYKDCPECPVNYDSGLVMLFAPSCFNNQYDENGALKDDEQWEWASKGAKREYDWAKAHHVKCLLLEPFLEGKEVLI